MDENESLSKKAEEFNEFMLKQAAITFSMEGVSRELKNFVQKKIMHNRNNLTQLTNMVRALSVADPKLLKECFTRKNSLMNNLFDHLLKEIKITDMALDLIVQNMLNKEAVLVTDKNQSQAKVTGQGSENDA